MLDILTVLILRVNIWRGWYISMRKIHLGSEYPHSSVWIVTWLNFLPITCFLSTVSFSFSHMNWGWKCMFRIKTASNLYKNKWNIPVFFKVLCLSANTWLSSSCGFMVTSTCCLMSRYWKIFENVLLCICRFLPMLIDAWSQARWKNIMFMKG